MITAVCYFGVTIQRQILERLSLSNCVYSSISIYTRYCLMSFILIHFPVCEGKSFLYFFPGSIYEISHLVVLDTMQYACLKQDTK